MNTTMLGRFGAIGIVLLATLPTSTSRADSG
jgi:hypothetical protein